MQTPTPAVPALALASLLALPGILVLLAPAAQAVAPSQVAPSQEAPAQEAPAQEAPTEEPGAAEARELAELLPPGTLYYLRVPSLDELRAAFEGTRLLELVRDEEVADFLEPLLSEIRDGLAAELEEEEPDREQLQRFLSGAGALTFALIRIELPENDPEVLFADDDPLPFVVLSLELEDAAAAFDWLVSKRTDEDAVLAEVAGRRALVDPEDPFALVLDGGRLVLGYGEGVLEELFAREEGGLGSSEAFQALKGELAPEPGALFAYLDGQGAVELFGRMLSASTAGFDAEAGRAMVSMTTDNPALAALREIGWSLVPAGAELLERIVIRTPDVDAFGPAGPLGDIPERHARLAPPATEIFWVSWVDVAEHLARERAEQQRILAIVEEMDKDSEVAELAQEEVNAGTLSGLLGRLREETGLDLEQELVPALGHGFSLAIDLPAGAALALPDVVLAIDVTDPERADAVLERLAAAAADSELLDVSSELVEGRRTLRIQLPGTGLPFVPTVARIEGYLLVALSPQTVAARAAALEGGEHLLGSGRYALPESPSEGVVSSALWLDLGGLYGWLAEISGFVMAMARQQGLDPGDRLDPAMLPTPGTMDELLGTGMMLAVRRPDALLLEGRSTLGNPLTGPFLAIGAVAGLYGAAEGLEESAAERRLEVSRSNMLALAEALEVYRTTAGGGTYPSELTALLDRGLLEDPEPLADPSDPRPRRLRTGDGQRVAVSYVIGRADALPPGVRATLGGEGEADEHVLRTRDAWHACGDGEAYLVLPLGPGTPRLHTIPRSAWK